MAVVIADLDRNVTVSNESLASENFIYYRLDLVDNVDICSSHGRLSTRGMSRKVCVCVCVCVSVGRSVGRSVRPSVRLSEHVIVCVYSVGNLHL